MMTMNSEEMESTSLVVLPPVRRDETAERRASVQDEGLRRTLQDLGKKMERMGLSPALVIWISGEVQEGFRRGVEAGADAVCPEYADLSLRAAAAEARLADLRRRFSVMRDLCSALEEKIRMRGGAR